MRLLAALLVALMACVLSLGARADPVAVPRPTGRHWKHKGRPRPRPTATASYPNTYDDDDDDDDDDDHHDDRDHDDDDDDDGYKKQGACVGGRFDPSDYTWSSPCVGKGRSRHGSGRGGRCCDRFVCKENDGDGAVRALFGDAHDGLVLSTLAPYRVDASNPGVPDEADNNEGACCVPQKDLHATGLFCKANLATNDASCPEEQWLFQNASDVQKNNAACACCDGVMQITDRTATCNPSGGADAFKCPEPYGNGSGKK